MGVVPHQEPRRDRDGEIRIDRVRIEQRARRRRPGEPQPFSLGEQPIVEPGFGRAETFQEVLVVAAEKRRQHRPLLAPRETGRVRVHPFDEVDGRRAVHQPDPFALDGDQGELSGALRPHDTAQQLAQVRVGLRGFAGGPQEVAQLRANQTLAGRQRQDGDDEIGLVGDLDRSVPHIEGWRADQLQSSRRSRRRQITHQPGARHIHRHLLVAACWGDHQDVAKSARRAPPMSLRPHGRRPVAAPVSGRTYQPFESASIESRLCHAQYRMLVRPFARWVLLWARCMRLDP